MISSTPPVRGALPPQPHPAASATTTPDVDVAPRRIRDCGWNVPPSAGTPPVTGYESVQDAREGGWLGQVPPPSPPIARCPPPASSGLDEVELGDETPHELRDKGWLGQVPPPTSAPARDARPGSGTSSLPDDGPPLSTDPGEWIGQVPAPAPTSSTPVDDAPAPTYANPQLAPDPWLDSGSLYPDDPTLFG